MFTQSQLEFIENVHDIALKIRNIKSDLAYWIGCQFALESNFGRSDLSIMNHNYCGMKLPFVRFTTAINYGDGSRWSVFADLTSCILDYFLCITYHKPICSDYESIDHYGKFLSKFYCPERDYIDKINRIYSQFKLQQNERTK